MAISTKLKNSNNILSNIAQIYPSVNKGTSNQNLPTCWSSKDRSRCLKISQSALTVTYNWDATDSRLNLSDEPGAVRSDQFIPLTAGIYYFETSVINFRQTCTISIGISRKQSKQPNKHPGWDSGSYGYHSDGSLYHGSPTNAIKFGPSFSENDTIGCGIDLLTKSLFFTRNGIFLGKAFEHKIPVSTDVKLYPAIGLKGQGCRTTTNFGDQPFRYAFQRHVIEERQSHESQLLDSVSKEFMGAKMRELVASYLVHHGYITSAQSFSRWAGLAGDNAPATIETEDANITEREHSPANPPSNLICGAGELPPGLSSMLHRRRLRAFCLRCQFGRAASTLTRLYPDVVEGHPDLLIQLRCRQLIEMMHRHSQLIQRNTTVSENGSVDFQPLSSGCRVASAKLTTTANTTTNSNSYGVGGTSESVPALTTCGRRQQLSPMIVKSEIKSHLPVKHLNESITYNNHHGFIPGSSAATSYDAMEIDNEPPNHQHTAKNNSLFTNSSTSSFSYHPNLSISIPTPSTEPANCDGALSRTKSASFSHPGCALGGGLIVDNLVHTADIFTDDDDEDGEGLDLEDEGQAVDEFGLEELEEEDDAFGRVDHPGMDVDAIIPNSTSASSSTTQICLSRQIQFARSLMGLVKEVRKKQGGASLPLETERLLQQSVSLLAYQSPSALDCPLRNLLDPSWRDSTASLINSTILIEAHNLPAQPAIEQGLQALHQCFTNPSLLPAQTLGHFLLYHLSPSDQEEAQANATLLNCEKQRLLDDQPKDGEVVLSNGFSRGKRTATTISSRQLRSATTTTNASTSIQRRRQQQQQRSSTTNTMTITSSGSNFSLLQNGVGGRHQRLQRRHQENAVVTESADVLDDDEDMEEDFIEAENEEEEEDEDEEEGDEDMILLADEFHHKDEDDDDDDIFPPPTGSESSGSFSHGGSGTFSTGSSRTRGSTNNRSGTGTTSNHNHVHNHCSFLVNSPRERRPPSAVIYRRNPN